MGYTTDFLGEFSIEPALTEQHLAYLEAFAETRRMKRDPQKLIDVPDEIRKKVNLPLGIEGEYYVGSFADKEFMGQDHTTDITNYNYPPGNQPGLWCQWVPNEDGTKLVWDQGEKFYYYEEWLTYLLKNFFHPWGYTLNGHVEWSGEERGDMGLLEIKNNVLKVKRARITYR